MHKYSCTGERFHRRYSTFSTFCSIKHDRLRLRLRLRLRTPSSVFFRPAALLCMGNSALSCAPSMVSNGAAKVLSLDGKLESYTKPVKAAELMIENSGKFVCDSGDLKVGHRIQGLLPDEDLECRRLYFLLPMDLLYSVLTFEEMSSLTYIATKALKHGNSNGFGKIFPILISEFCIFPSEVNGLKPADGDLENENSKPVQRLMSKQRSWKPALETIAEASCT